MDHFKRQALRVTLGFGPVRLWQWLWLRLESPALDLYIISIFQAVVVLSLLLLKLCSWVVVGQSCQKCCCLPYSQQPLFVIMMMMGCWPLERRHWISLGQEEGTLIALLFQYHHNFLLIGIEWPRLFWVFSNFQDCTLIFLMICRKKYNRSLNNVPIVTISNQDSGSVW